MNKKTAEIHLSTAFITLGQLLKIAGIIDSGGEAKELLARHAINVDGAPDNRRGRKLYPGAMVEIEGNAYRILKR